MSESMSVGVNWLTLTILMTALMWVPYIFNRIIELGVVDALMDPYGATKAKANWANRMMAAHVNAVENLVIIVPLVILLEIYHLDSEATGFAVQIYFFSRLAHYLLFTFAMPFLRIASFLVGFGVQMYLGSILLGLL